MTLITFVRSKQRLSLLSSTNPFGARQFSWRVLFIWTRAGPVLGATRAGPGGGCLTPPSNSAPGPRSVTRQAALECSSKIITKVLRLFLKSGQSSGHQRSSKWKCSRISRISIIFRFRSSNSRTRRARATRKKQTMPIYRSIWSKSSDLTTGQRFSLQG